jgi:hypothetical protein
VLDGRRWRIRQKLPFGTRDDSSTSTFHDLATGTQLTATG